MVEFLGWIGFFLFISTLIPFVMYRLRLGLSGGNFFIRYHHSLALASLVVVILHGILALTGKRGWQWGKLAQLNGDILTGITSWSVMLVIVVLAVFAIRKKLFTRSHCWLVGLLVALVLYHVT